MLYNIDSVSFSCLTRLCGLSLGKGKGRGRVRPEDEEELGNARPSAPSTLFDFLESKMGTLTVEGKQEMSVFIFRENLLVQNCTWVAALLMKNQSSLKKTALYLAQIFTHTTKQHGSLEVEISPHNQEAVNLVLGSGRYISLWAQ